LYQNRQSYTEFVTKYVTSEQFTLQKPRVCKHK